MADIGIGIGTSIAAGVILDAIKYIKEKFKTDNNPSKYKKILESAIHEASCKILKNEDKVLSFIFGEKLEEILSDPAELLSSPAIHKDDFMKRLSDSNIPADLRSKIFDEVEAAFFKSLYEDSVKNDAEFRKTIVSRVNEILIRQNKSAAAENQILDAVNSFAKNEENWEKALTSLEKIEQATQKTYELLVNLHGNVSCASIGVDDTLGEEILRTIAHVKQPSISPSKRLGLEVPFVSYCNDDRNLLNTLESKKSLFIRGVSGCGKSRVLYEALRKRKHRAKTIWVLGAGSTLNERLKGTATVKSVPISELIRNIYLSSVTDSGTQLLVWDNFPDGLLGSAPLLAILTELSRLEPEGLESLITLKPEKYRTDDDPAKPADFKSLDIIYSFEQFEKLLDIFGNTYLNPDDYMRRVEPYLEKLSVKLFENWNVPIAIEIFYAKATFGKVEDLLVLAETLSDAEKADVFRDLVDRFEKSFKEFLWTLKAARLLGEDRSRENIEQLQKDIFGDVLEDPQARLGSFFYEEERRFQMHDFYMNELRFSEDCLDHIFSYIEREGFVGFFYRTFNKLTSDGWFELGLFLAQNTRHYSIAALLKDLKTEWFVSRQVGAIMNDQFEKKKPVRLIVMPTDEEIRNAIRLGTFKIVDEAVWVFSPSEELVRGIGAGFCYLRTKDKTEVLKLIGNNDFASWFGSGVSKNMLSLNVDDRKMFLDLAGEEGNERFASGLLGSLTSFLLINQDEKELILNLAKKSRYLSSLVGDGMGGVFNSLRTEERELVFSFAKLNPFFAFDLGNGIGKAILSLNEETVKHILDFAKLDEEFTRGLFSEESSICTANLFKGGDFLKYVLRLAESESDSGVDVCCSLWRSYRDINSEGRKTLLDLTLTKLKTDPLQTKIGLAFAKVYNSCWDEGESLLRDIAKGNEIFSVALKNGLEIRTKEFQNKAKEIFDKHEIDPKSTLHQLQQLEHDLWRRGNRDYISEEQCDFLEGIIHDYKEKIKKAYDDTTN